MEDIMKLCDVVRETGFAIHRYHKHGHLEKVYENALAHRLRKLGLDVKQQYPLKVYDEDGTLIGDYNADLKGSRNILFLHTSTSPLWFS
jgi:GxxExxY protein